MSEFQSSVDTLTVGEIFIKFHERNNKAAKRFVSYTIYHIG